jgi:uncharacterized coiled-coil DUF342 family protein
MHPNTKKALEHLAVIQHITRLQEMMNNQRPLENYDASTEKALNTIEMIADSDLRMRNMYNNGGDNMPGMPARPIPNQNNSNANTPAGRSTTKERVLTQKVAELENENAQMKQTIRTFEDKKGEIYDKVNSLRQRLDAEFFKITEEVYDNFFPGA